MITILLHLKYNTFTVYCITYTVIHITYNTHILVGGSNLIQTLSVSQKP